MGKAWKVADKWKPDQVPTIAIDVPGHACAVGVYSTGRRYHRVARERADLIVRAVNAHEELLAACQGLLDFVTSRFPADDPACRSEVYAAIAAISKAKGGSP